MKKDVRQLIRQLAKDGWRHEFTGKDHIRLIHPSGVSVITSLTPSCCFWRKKVKGDINRLLKNLKVEGGALATGHVRQ